MTDDDIYDLLWRLAASPDQTANLLTLEPAVLHRVMTIARIHGVLGIILSQGGDTESGTGTTWENVRRAWKGQLIHSMRVRHHARNLLDRFKQAKIPAVLFKGSDFADNMYPNPRLRPTMDVDILVPMDAWHEAIKVLEALGHTQKPNQPSPFNPAGVISERTWISSSQGMSIEVDLHWSLVHFPEFRRQVALSYWDLDWNWLPGGQGELTPATRLVIAAVHLVYHHQFDRLLQLVDIQYACAKVGTDDEMQRVLALAERTAAKLALDVALQITSRFLKSPAIERFRLALLGDKLPWGPLPEAFFRDARGNLRSIRTSLSSERGQRICRWLMKQPLKPKPGWELHPPFNSGEHNPEKPQALPSPIPGWTSPGSWVGIGWRKKT